MIILGIDPGTATTGFGFVEVTGNKTSLVKYGVVKTSSKTKAHLRLLGISKQLGKEIKAVKPDVVAVEKLFFGVNAKTAILVGEARGVILLTCAQQGLEVVEYTPLEVKMALTGYGRAEKQQIQQMVKRLLCLKDIPKPDDAADALAIAITHAHSYKIKGRMS
ncbi:MAG: crossover junction endodeoxyribonuclease RuvC [Candidatus Saganbacteria bacterium]|nr:crossover junction endodeoxyribonuclease RuvC [Candidatus Saganbacteria bacterium]